MAVAQWGATPEIADGVQLLYYDLMGTPEKAFLHVAARTLVPVPEDEVRDSVARRVGPHWWLLVPDAARGARLQVAEASRLVREGSGKEVPGGALCVVVFSFETRAGAWSPSRLREAQQPRLGAFPLALRPTPVWARPASPLILGSSAALHARLAELGEEGYPMVPQMREALRVPPSDSRVRAAIEHGVRSALHHLHAPAPGLRAADKMSAGSESEATGATDAAPAEETGTTDAAPAEETGATDAGPTEEPVARHAHVETGAAPAETPVAEGQAEEPDDAATVVRRPPLKDVQVPFFSGSVVARQVTDAPTRGPSGAEPRQVSSRVYTSKGKTSTRPAGGARGGGGDSDPDSDS